MGCGSLVGVSRTPCLGGEEARPLNEFRMKGIHNEILERLGTPWRFSRYLKGANAIMLLVILKPLKQSKI